MGVDGQRQAPAALPQQKRPSNHCTGGWVGPRAGLDGCGKFHPPQPGFDPRTVQSVASRYRLRYLGPPILNICFNFERPCILLTRCRYRLYWYFSYDVQKSSCNFNKILTMECDNTCLVTVNLEGTSKCSVSKIIFWDDIFPLFWLKSVIHKFCVWLIWDNIYLSKISLWVWSVLRSIMFCKP